MSKTDTAQLQKLKRQLQVEAALDRTHYLTMSMRRSQELTDVIKAVFKEATRLGFGAQAYDLVILDKESAASIFWFSGELDRDNDDEVVHFKVPKINHRHYLEGLEAWRRRRKIRHRELKGNSGKSYMQRLFQEIENNNVREFARIVKSLASIHHTEAYMRYGYFRVASREPLKKDEEKILFRFAKVFEQAYARFLDLKKAEAQACEAQIEAALERVRARTMAMHESEELGEVSEVMFNQLRQFGADLWASGFVLCDQKTVETEHWMSVEAGKLSLAKVPRNLDHIHQAMYKAWKDGTKLLTRVIEGKELKQHHKTMARIPSLKENVGIATKIKALRWQKNHVAPFKYGYLLVATASPFDEMQIFPRFAGVFEQTYTRFLDLQKAEAQAREAQIEAALEKVRNRTLIMKESGELNQAVAVFFRQFQALGLLPAEARSYFCHIDTERDVAKVWMTHSDGTVMTGHHETPLTQSKSMAQYYESWKQGEPISERKYSGKKLSEYLEFVSTLPHIKKDKDYRKLFRSPPDQIVMTDANFKQGNIGIMTFESLSQEALDTLIRFAKVFEFTYTRFLDLKKAEAQAREAQIETALERVRSRTMAMHHSQELLSVVGVMYEQMEPLGLASDGCELILCNEQEDRLEYWHSNPVQPVPECYHVPRQIHPFFRKQWRAWKEEIPRLLIKQKGKQKREFDELLFEKTDFKRIPAKIKKWILGEEIAVFSHVTMKYGLLEAVDKEPLSEEKLLTLERFAKVFEQTYTRFLDLQKAETQAREAQIEAALERLRARTMAMHTTTELEECVYLLFDELGELNIKPRSCGIVLPNPEDERIGQTWLILREAGAKRHHKEDVDFSSHPQLKHCWKSWKAGEAFCPITITKELAKDYFTSVLGRKAGPAIRDFNEAVHFCFANFKYGMVYGSFLKTLDEEISILKRFAKVFEQTYTRFLDLQKAEAQAREARIEASLERVRARTMAMHKSEELSDVIAVVFEQMELLEIISGGCCVIIFDTEENSALYYFAGFGREQYLESYSIPYNEHPYYLSQLNAWRDKEEYKMTEFYGELKREYDDWLFEETNWKNMPETLKEGTRAQTYVAICDAVMSHGLLEAVCPEPLPEDKVEVLKRMARVFDQSYSRFLDLQKAEAQAREAQIEASLERVRASAMAMHDSQDVYDATTVMFEELDRLGIGTIRCGVSLIDPAQRMDVFASTTGQKGVMQAGGSVDMSLHPLLRAAFKAWKRQESQFSYELTQKEAKGYYDIILSKTDLSIPKPATYDRQFVNTFNFAEGALFAFTTHQLPTEALQIFLRFTGVFTLTYRRYLDLQQSEDQAREAQIQVALERVRARALAMHTSREITDVAQVLREQMANLNQPELGGCVIHVYPEDAETFDSWFAFRPYKQKNVVVGSVKFPTKSTALTRKWLKLYRSDQNEYTIKSHGKEYREWLELRNRTIGATLFKPLGDVTTNYYHCSDFTGGTLITSSNAAPSQEVKDLQKRAASVFDLAYRRYLDLKEAEARETEAIKQSSLDRVRAEIASMRTAKDLNRITPLVWRELTTLGVPFFRCGVFIMDEEAEVAHAYLSTPDGKSLGALRLEYTSMPLVENASRHWRKKQVYREEWDKAQFIRWTKPLLEQGQIKSAEKYQAGKDAPENLVLHMVPFTQGMLYVGSAEALTSDQIELVHSLADAFAVAYARYEDFKELEEAKARVEATVEELKSTQTQLVHSEKMASLGELTAGIAHEIQNPLNFVNNFSEVNKELIQELKEELEKGNIEEVNALVQDIIENEEKVMHHGKRAEGIVKSMLQHSRGSTDTYELTDLNVLVDEYLRLSYHGLRAKDKSFNADFETDLYPSLPKVRVIPQDIGRVLLNLINNAFYAVSARARERERARATATRRSDYKPRVLVSTGINGRAIEIRVQDNGPGIPEGVKEKIFQPFFSTKPTGEGTGLGLSLSYDIINKGHGGELRVETEEGEGTQFLISLPI